MGKAGGPGIARNTFFFGVGTIGRDWVYTIISMFILFYITDVLLLSNLEIGIVTGAMVAVRVWDAINDPIMGTIVDNTSSKWGKFKPWMLAGVGVSAILVVGVFGMFPLLEVSRTAYIILFCVAYLFWEMAFTANDISYWSMMPSLTDNQKHREIIGTVARICANVGLFFCAVAIIPFTGWLEGKVGSAKIAWFIFAFAAAIAMVGFQLFTVFGVKEPKVAVKPPERTTLKGMAKAVFKNDQLLVLALSMTLFMTGYMITTGFGTYFFKYDYGNLDMYSLFALVLGVSQVAALIAFPFLSKKFKRETLFFTGIILMTAGYISFIFAGDASWQFLPKDAFYASGVLLFVGQAFIQLLILVHLADTVEYGEWKLGKRNESVSFALQPFINKLSGAIAQGVISATLIISRISDAARELDAVDPNAISGVDYVTDWGRLIMRISMMVIPMLMIAGSYVIFRGKFKINKEKFDQIKADLELRRQAEEVD